MLEKKMRKSLKHLCLVSVIFLASCFEPLQIKGVKVTKGVVEATVSSVNSGTVRAERAVDLAFGTVGRVAKLTVSLGQFVKKGEVLAELENGAARSAVQMMTREVARLQSLDRSNVSSKQELERAQDQLLANISRLDDSIIRAPFDGYVVDLNMEVGQLSQITAVIPKPLIRLVDTDPRYIRAEIDEVDLSKVRLGQAARVRVLAFGREPLLGKVRRIVPTVSTYREQDRSVPIEIEVDSATLLPDGASADVEIITDRREGVLTVPTRYVRGLAGDRYVYRLSGENAQKTPVVIGIYNYDRAEVVSGIQEGEFVLLPSEEELSGKRVQVEEEHGSSD